MTTAISLLIIVFMVATILLFSKTMEDRSFNKETNIVHIERCKTCLGIRYGGPGDYIMRCFGIRLNCTSTYSKMHTDIF